MRLRRPAWMLLLLMPVAAAFADGHDLTDREALEAIYDYDAAAPLDAEVVSVDDRGIYLIERISFTGAAGERVPATLFRPPGVERPPVVLFLHGLGGDRSQAQVAATLLIPQGVAVLGIDAALHGERADPQIDFAAMGPELAELDGPLVRTIVDNRRAIDYIESREDLDGERIVLIGASMGGILGSIVSAVDPRVQAAALLVAGGDWSAIIQHSHHPLAQRLQAAGIGDGRALAHVDPVSFVAGIAPRPLLMINGTDDEIIPKNSAEALFEAASEPREIRWYEGGHIDIPPDEIFFLATWVRERAYGENDR